VLPTALELPPDSLHTNSVWKECQSIIFHLLRAHLGEDLPVAGIGHSWSERDRDLALDDTSPRSRVAVAERP
jgi:hypothetical protein